VSLDWSRLGDDLDWYRVEWRDEGRGPALLRAEPMR
jgi:hypothetical protein